MKKVRGEAVSIAELNECLKSWSALNDFLRTATEGLCANLLLSEQLGKKRRQFLLRIHSRLNKVRSVRERKELVR